MGQQGLTIGKGALEGPPCVNPVGVHPKPYHQAQNLGLGHLRAKNCQKGSETPPISRSWIKDLLSKALPHCQSHPSRSLHKSLSLIHQRADRRSKKHSLIAAKTKPILWKVNHNEKADSMCQMKRQDKIPENTSK